jgi:Uncharacterized conserved protein (DUF2203)
MKPNPKRAKKRVKVIPVWTYSQAVSVLPYVTSIMNSLREHQLDAQRHELVARRLAAKPGRPDRATLIDQEEAGREAQRSSKRFQQALEELHSLGIFCLDATRGEALIPFAQDKQLAWFVFDLFDSVALRSWRYHSDPLETRRPVGEQQKGTGVSPQVA